MVPQSTADSKDLEPEEAAAAAVAAEAVVVAAEAAQVLPESTELVSEAAAAPPPSSEWQSSTEEKGLGGGCKCYNRASLCRALVYSQYRWPNPCSDLASLACTLTQKVVVY